MDNTTIRTASVATTISCSNITHNAGNEGVILQYE